MQQVASNRAFYEKVILQGPDEQQAILVLLHNATRKGSDTYSISSWAIKLIYADMENEEDDDVAEWFTLLLTALLEP